MIILEDILISDDLRDVYFCCDLQQCKGACCVEGDAGAPLEEEEISLLEDYIDIIKLFMIPKGTMEVEATGVFDYDADGKFVTPLVNGKECSYVYFEDGIARCAIEKAFQENAIPFPKPLSCHLYPIRISQVGKKDAINYHKWHICNKALKNGMKLKTPLYYFLKDALIRKYGRSWYNELIRLLINQ
jgi:hypothetical protein